MNSLFILQGRDNPTATTQVPIISLGAAFLVTFASCVKAADANLSYDTSITAITLARRQHAEIQNK